VGGYIFIIVILILMWFLLIRPQRRRQQDSQRLIASLSVGQEIVTAGGLYGTITALEEDEARVEIADGIDGLLHVSDMSWTKKIANPAEVVNKGDKVKALVLSVDKDKKRIALGMKQLELDPWQHDIAERFGPNTEHIGEVTKVTNFGVFVSFAIFAVVAISSLMAV